MFQMICVLPLKVLWILGLFEQFHLMHFHGMSLTWPDFFSLFCKYYIVSFLWHNSTFFIAEGFKME